MSASKYSEILSLALDMPSLEADEGEVESFAPLNFCLKLSEVDLVLLHCQFQIPLKF